MIPQASDLKKLDIGYEGLPFVRIPASTGITLAGLNVAYEALPFTGNEDNITSNILKVSGVAYASISKVSGVARGSMSKVAGIA